MTAYKVMRRNGTSVYNEMAQMIRHFYSVVVSWDSWPLCASIFTSQNEKQIYTNLTKTWKQAYKK